MWWGGLRGAVGFSLAMVLKEEMWYRCEYHSYYHHFYPEIFMNIENMLCNFIIMFFPPVYKPPIMIQGTFPDNGSCHGPLHCLPTGFNLYVDQAF